MRRACYAIPALFALGLVFLIVPSVRAQYVVHPQVVLPSVSYSYYPSRVVPAVSTYTPVTSYYVAPAVSYYQPSISYYQPAVSYYPTTTYYAPATSYYALVTSYYAPTTSYYAPGTVTTRSFVGLGIFRPRGVYTQTYVTRGSTSFYSPVIWR